jgi:cytidine deaminase
MTTILDFQTSALISAARKGMHHAFTGTQSESQARFGAAVLTTRGNIYSAGQYFSDTLSLTLHAEQAALVHAAAHGEYEIAAIVCLGNESAHRLSRGFIYPCHLCKQLLWESYLRSRVNTEIYMVNLDDHIEEKVFLLDMMNHPWPLDLST